MPTACDEGGFNIDLEAEHERRSAVFNWLVDSEEVCFQGNRVEQWKVFLNVKGHTPSRYFNREDTPPTSAFLATDISVQRNSTFRQQIRRYNILPLTYEVVPLF